jgi:hypothetical protein
MMSSDVIVSESMGLGNFDDKVGLMADPRFQRDAQKDLHEAIDLAFSFSKTIRSLHPIAEKQIKAMIMQGNLI